MFPERPLPFFLFAFRREQGGYFERQHRQYAGHDIKNKPGQQPEQQGLAQSLHLQ